MKFQVIVSVKASKKIKKMDKGTQRLILSYINRHLHNTCDPRISGKALTGNLSGLWRYRIGDYRLLASIKDSELLIIAVDVDHRSKVYK